MNCRVLNRGCWYGRIYALGVLGTDWHGDEKRHTESKDEIRENPQHAFHLESQMKHWAAHRKSYF